MQINDDLGKPVIVHAARQDWVPSPSAGVDRRMLDEALEPRSWGRLPAGHALEAQVGSDGATVWIKEGPLQHRNILAMPG